MATWLTGAKEILLIDDVNQFSLIDSLNFFEMQYIRRNLVTTVTKELLLTYRNPMDVALTLNEVYSGVYSSKIWVQSLRLETYSDANIPKDLPNIFYLTYTQVEKESLIIQTFGKGKGTRVLTIDEAQGLTSEGTLIMRIAAKNKLHDHVSHAVVAMTRHTVSSAYYTDDDEDAIGRCIRRAVAASENKIKGNNAKMAIRIFTIFKSKYKK
ncbi:hypothetical protein EVAR_64221_1 [Eumeta japonica]|uniref:(+)RNA virus helicase C-terminal domain-containing protein n=1 Tax=Eumeta variegata TaxID=151549 RepID=A0A4C1ZQ47_EUMVA|nr:hypothetical protein EVAR_64221_1 [Eumeta japonica]